MRIGSKFSLPWRGPPGATHVIPSLLNCGLSQDKHCQASSMQASAGLLGAWPGIQGGSYKDQPQHKDPHGRLTARCSLHGRSWQQGMALDLAFSAKGLLVSLTQ